MSEFLYSALEQYLAEGIAQGRWQAGERLPSIRSLAQEQALSKTTVMHALSRLEARGLIEARPKAGYFVRARHKTIQPPTAPAHTADPTPVSVSAVTQDLMCRSAAFDILPEVEAKTGQAPGLLQLNRTVARELRRQRGQQHQYYDALAGSEPLRDALARRYKRQGCLLEADDLTVTAGCQQALFFSLMCLCQPGDLVAIESPGFYGVLQLAETLGLKVLEIPSTPDQGIDLDALAASAERWSIKVCVVTPSYATPSGALMPLENRKQILNLAQQFDFHIIEDDIYRELAFTRPLPPIQSFDSEGRVLLCGSVSKTLSRELRVGWVSSRKYRAELQRLKLVTSLAGSRYVQNGLAAFIEDGGYDRHLRRYLPQLQAQRDELISFIQDNWPVACAFHPPEGGLTLWLQLPEPIDTMKVYALARDQGILITPGVLFSASGRYPNCLRLSYAHPWTEERLKALDKLGLIISALI